MLKTLWNIKLINTGTGQEVYNENQSFNGFEPNKENITDFISFIRPKLRFDYVDFSFVGNLAEGRLIKD